MANPHYTDIGSRKVLQGTGGSKETTKRGPKKGQAMKYRCPDWGLHGAPKQKRDRSAGIAEVKIYAKAEGLSTYGPAPLGGRGGMRPVPVGLPSQVVPAMQRRAMPTVPSGASQLPFGTFLP